MNDFESTAPSVIAPVAPVIPAAETPVAVPQATPDPAPTAEPGAETPEGDDPQAAKPEKSYTEADFQKALQKRLGIESRRLQKLTEAQLRAEYAEKQLAEFKAPAASAQPSGEPKPEQFKDYESYIAALTDYKVDQRMGGIRKETEAQQQQRQMAEQANAVLPKLKPAMEKYDDFQEVATSFNAPPAVQAACLDSDITGELYYFLGNNPDELARISRLPEVKQVRAVLDLEAKLTAAPSPTRTPAPIVPNSGKSPVSKGLSDMPYDEFVAAREKRLRGQRKR